MQMLYQMQEKQDRTGDANHDPNQFEVIQSNFMWFFKKADKISEHYPNQSGYDYVIGILPM